VHISLLIVLVTPRSLPKLFRISLSRLLFICYRTSCIYYTHRYIWLNGSLFRPKMSSSKELQLRQLLAVIWSQHSQRQMGSTLPRGIVAPAFAIIAWLFVSMLSSGQLWCDVSGSCALVLRQFAATRVVGSLPIATVCICKPLEMVTSGPVIL
jgi:hypothetical protein